MEYRLRELKIKDCEGMLEWMHDPEINCYYTDNVRNATKESVTTFIEASLIQRKEGSTYHYAIVDSNDEYLGTISLKNIEKIKGAEYAISLRGAFQRKGIASFATKEILRIAFVELGLNRVYLNVLSDNRHANRFYEKNRFRYEGESVNCIMIDGELKSLKWYAILNKEYQSL